MILKDLLPSYKPYSGFKPEYRFTIFTPVYNRADTLKRVHDSLLKQTYKNFEWILINDGSTDNSNEVINEIISITDFPVVYINNKDNKHKMACFKQAIEIAKGEFILPFDSDDACTEDALEVFNQEYEAIPDDKKPTISGVTCLCKSQDGDLIGSKFKIQPYYSNTFKKQLDHSEASEKWGFTKTSILKGMDINTDIFAKGYIPEGIIWELISKNNFSTKYINTVLRIYYLDTENAISIQNHEKDAFGMAIYSLAIINWFYKSHLFRVPSLFLKRIFTLLRAANYLDYSFNQYWHSIDSFLLKLLFLIGWPFKKIFSKT